MTTLAVDTPRDWEIGERNEFPVVASDIIYEGAAVGMVLATGHTRPLTSSDRFVGFAEKKADNSAGGAAAINVRVIKKGAAVLAVTGAVITDINLPVYATDDNTFTFLKTGGVFIGFSRRYVSAGYAVVEFNAGVLTDPHEGLFAESAADNVTIDAQDTGKAIFVTANAKTITLPGIEGVGRFRIVNGGAYGVVGITIAPNSIDMVEGTNQAVADNGTWANTQATACRGDYIDLEYGDANGWAITKKVGTWAYTAPAT